MLIHALNVPISKDTKFEALELMRLDLIDHLEFVTRSCADADRDGLAWSVREIEEVAKRLSEVSVLMAGAATKAIEAGRVEFGWQAEERGRTLTEPKVNLAGATEFNLRNAQANDPS